MRVLVVYLLGSLLLCQVSLIHSKFVAAVVLPHGDEALDPTSLEPNTPARAAAQKIAEESRKAAAWFTEENDFDVIFFSTPHGIQLTQDYGIYYGSHASGSINVSSETLEMPPITLAGDLSLDLTVKMTSIHAFPVSGIATSADGSTDLPLEWAEIIPLMLMPESKRHTYKYILWSYPLERYTESQKMVPELISMGSYLRGWMEALPLRIGVVISGDMSHTHQATGPYGYSNASAPFDEAVENWAFHPNKLSASLMSEAKYLQPRAMSCGFTGLVLLHGILCSNDNWPPVDDGRVYVSRNATYYGMMAATFAAPSSGGMGES